jgi:superfamily II DNA or RNA helicase
VVRASREERRRARSLLKQKDLARRRHEEQTFLGAFRRLVADGWGPPGFDDHIAGDPSPDVFRATVEDVCASAGVRMGSPESWEYVASVLRGAGAPPAEMLAWSEKWGHAMPEERLCHLNRVEALILAGRREEAEAAARKAFSGQVPGADMEGRLRTISRLLGLDFDPVAPARAARQRAGTSPGRARGPMAPRREEPLRDQYLVVPALPDVSRPSAPSPAARRTNLTRRARIPEAAPLSFDPGPDSSLLEKLLGGHHDAASTLDLARRAIEVLAEDQYDRLISLPAVRGIQHLGYQVETALRVLKRFRGRVLLADEVGLGKTIEACLVLKEYLMRGQVKRALILVPAALVGQWKAELEEKFSIHAFTTQDAGFRSDPEGFWRSECVLVASVAIARMAAHREKILERSFDLVIVDEAHHLKNRSTRGWDLVNRLRSRFFLMLTATPVETHLGELYNLITLLRPGTLGTEAEFRRRFVRSGDPARPRDPEKLRGLLKDVMVRNTRALSGVHLPPRTAKTIVVAPTAEEEGLYRLVLDAARRHGLEKRTLFRLLLEEAGSSPLSVAETASRARLECEDDGVAEALARIEEAARGVGRTTKLERIRGLIPGGKVLLFSRFRATLEEISAFLEAEGVRFAAFHGGMAAAEKDRSVEDFSGPGTDIMLCSEIGGEGRNLQFCHRLINFDLPWNPMQIEQRIGRIHRIGQTEAVEVVNLAAAGTAEERILDVLDRRVNLFELVVGEMDLILGDLEDERDFGEQVYDIYTRSRGEAEVKDGFRALAERLLEGRRRLEKVKALDETLFGEDYDT